MRGLLASGDTYLVRRVFNLALVWKEVGRGAPVSLPPSLPPFLPTSLLPAPTSPFPSFLSLPLDLFCHGLDWSGLLCFFWFRFGFDCVSVSLVDFGFVLGWFGF